MRIPLALEDTVGTWTLLRVDGRLLSRNNGLKDDDGQFGHFFEVHFSLRYKPALLGNWQDHPKLYWGEVIQVKDLRAKTWWEFSTNMYELKPLSPTLCPWPKRYLFAWQCANAEKSIDEHFAQLCDLNGNGVTIDQLGGSLKSNQNKEKIDAVQGYLKRHGGILKVKFIDVPSLTLTSEVGKGSPEMQKERLLRFDIGLVGNLMQRLRAEQYLRIDETHHRQTWVRDFSVCQYRRTLNFADFTKVDAPANVRTTKPTPLLKKDGHVP